MRNLLLISLVLFSCVYANAATYDLISPNGKIKVTVQTGERITYDVSVNGQTVLRNAAMSLDLDHQIFGTRPKNEVKLTNRVERDIQSPVPQKSAKIHEIYN
jgi:alpha-glucosidase